MQMTEAFASTMAVTIPILALAAGAEARGIRDRIKQPDEQWELEYARYKEAHQLDTGKSASDVLSYFKGVPHLSKLYFIERVVAIAGALVWLFVFLLLTVDELLCLVWLSGAAAAGDSALAFFSIVSVGISMVALIVTPALYFLVPVLVPLDLIPDGLKKTLSPELQSESGKGFIKRFFQELEGAIDRAADDQDAEDVVEPAPDFGDDEQQGAAWEAAQQAQRAQEAQRRVGEARLRAEQAKLQAEQSEQSEQRGPNADAGVVGADSDSDAEPAV